MDNAAFQIAHKESRAMKDHASREGVACVIALRVRQRAMRLVHRKGSSR